jgi:antitoxin (DNA-binding transcriptional repressor) of toxin-antitoxin stability system
MAVIHISESEAVRDFASVLAKVRAGTEIVIDSETVPVAFLVPATEAIATPDPAHDAWFRAQVQDALDDSSTDVPSEEVEALFAKRREASQLKMTGTAG